MIRLLIKDYSLQEKVALWRSLKRSSINAKCDGASEIVAEDISKACDWLKSQIDKEANKKMKKVQEGHNYAQNR